MEAVEAKRALRQLFLPGLVDIEYVTEVKRIREAQRGRGYAQLAQLRVVFLLQDLALRILDAGNRDCLGSPAESQGKNGHNEERAPSTSHISLPEFDRADRQSSACKQ